MYLIKYDNIAKVLYSVLSDGERSVHLNSFVKTCTNITVLYLKKSVFVNDLLNKSGSTLNQLAIDFLADLFENKDGKFLILRKFFNDFLKNEGDAKDEEIMSRLVVLIRSNSNQMISEMREQHGEIYFKIKKAFNIYLGREKKIKEVIFRDKSYFYTCRANEVNFCFPLITYDDMLDNLTLSLIDNESIPELIKICFDNLNNSNLYCKAIEKGTFLNVITEFYKIRLKEHIFSENFVNWNGNFYFNID